MRQLFRKPWFLGVSILSLLTLVLLINVWVLSLELKVPFDNDTFWSLSRDYETLEMMPIFSLIIVILFYGSMLPLLLIGISIIRKKRRAILGSIGYFLGFITTLIVFQVVTGYLSTPALVLLMINLVIMIMSVIAYMIRNSYLGTEKKEETDIVKQLKDSNIPLGVLLIDIVSILVYLTVFFVPMFTHTTSPAYHAILIRALFFGDTNIEVIAFFLANFAMLLGVFLYFSDVISHYFFDVERFIKKSRVLVNVLFILTLVFFFAGLGMTIFYTLEGTPAQTISFIPLSLMVLVIFVFAVFKGKYHMTHPLEYKKRQVKYVRSEPLLYVMLMTGVTLLLLFLPIVVISISFGTFEYTVDLTGLAILRDYPSLEPGYRMVAFVLVVMLIASGLSLVSSITSYLANSKQFNSIIKFSTYTNLFFIFIIAISGYYFQIAQEINQSVMHDMFEFYGIILTEGLAYEYVVGTNAIYALIIAVFILSLMFFRKAFERTDIGAVVAVELPNSENVLEDSQKPNKETDETETQAVSNFDPAPAFTELDSKIELFQQDLENRQSLEVRETTLNQLIHFVVEYARNSRLHLSYTEEDIATFVAGMGASKLSILQGMSGTGKTSLPKIFSEAIYGNCDIIEVESSWKDKNELLGYYNEFSMKYTPKKFTLALYKAALNPDIFTFILLDEMNLSRIEYYFSDFLSLMENEENAREIKLINIPLKRLVEGEEISYKALDQGHTLKVPKNVWFIGTANRDESTFVISDKVYDRAHTMNFTKRAPKVRNYGEPMSKQYYNQDIIQSLFNEAKQKGDFDAEKSELIKQVEVLLAPFNISFGNRILKQIEDFVNIYKACFKGADVESEAVEKILLSKVVSKLETKTIDDKEKLEQDFLKLKLNQCALFIRRLDND